MDRSVFHVSNVASLFLITLMVLSPYIPKNPSTPILKNRSQWLVQIRGLNTQPMRILVRSSSGSIITGDMGSHITLSECFLWTEGRDPVKIHPTLVLQDQNNHHNSGFVKHPCVKSAQFTSINLISHMSKSDWIKYYFNMS